MLSDLNCKETGIGLLIGADNVGKLLTGNLNELDYGLTAIETKLGWMILGTCQNLVSEQLLELEEAMQEYLDDMEDTENNHDRYIEMFYRVHLKIRETVIPTETEKRSFKLPKIEMKKFRRQS
ncbi:hypothetical protein TNCV_5000301 [Trichonephila clavipes]|nr:hypothetical protein TNCV_5000301 [Trichonephila clavipes]